MSTFTAELQGTQRGQPRQQQAPPRVPAVVTDCGQCGRPTAVPVNAPGPHRCQRCKDSAARRQGADDSRADRLFIGSCGRMSEADLRDVVESMHRHDGPIYEWCREQAAGILFERFGVGLPLPAVTDAGLIGQLRRRMVEMGEAEFATMSDADVAAEFATLGVNEDGDDWDRERAAQAAWAEGQAEGARAETDG